MLWKFKFSPFKSFIVLTFQIFWRVRIWCESGINFSVFMHNGSIRKKFNLIFLASKSLLVVYRTNILNIFTTFFIVKQVLKIRWTKNGTAPDPAINFFISSYSIKPDAPTVHLYLTFFFLFPHFAQFFQTSEPLKKDPSLFLPTFFWLLDCRSVQDRELDPDP